MKYSSNKKLNNVLNYIENELLELGLDEVKHYYDEFKGEVDYNLAQYGNLTVYYYDVRGIYKDYKSLQNVSDSKIWDIYKRQVGYVARRLMAKNKLNKRLTNV